MLRAIHIQQFGRFRNTSFALEPVTVFAGPNQSGKTTLFDAVRIHTFRPDRRGKDNRALYARYGDETAVELAWEPAPPEMSDAEFMNLFAVHAGELTVNLSGDWLAAVKKSLFAGGIDPHNLVREFERLASEKGTLAHMRDRARAEAQRRDLADALAEKAQQRDEILAELDAQASRRTELKQLDERLAARQGEEEQLAAEVAWQARIAERRRLEEQVRLLDQIGELEQRQQADAAFAQDRTAELEQREQDSRRRAEARAQAEAALAHQQGELAEEREALAAVDAELERRATWRRAVETADARRTLYQSRKLTNLLVLGAAGIFAIVMGVGLLVLSGMAGWGWAALAAGVVAGVALLVVPAPLAERLFMRGLKDAWRSEVGASVSEPRAAAVLDAGTLDGLTDALSRVTAELDELERRRQGAARALAEQEAQVQGARERLDAAIRAEREADEALAGWLAHYGVESRDAYRDRLSEYRRNQTTLGERYRWLEQTLAQGGHADAVALRADVERRLRVLDEEGVPRAGVPEEQRLADERRLEALRDELARLQQQRHALDRDAHGTSERLVGQLGNLPEEIARLAEQVRRLESQIAEIDLNRRAALRAAELFQAVADDESAVLADLSHGVARTFAAISGAGAGEAVGEATVALGGLRNEAITAMDGQGTVRAVDHLSSGARHLLYLALRLEMARRERQGRDALLCLDEPFAFLDPERQMETLSYLKAFLAETGWQLILFTNEPAQAERAQAVFPHCRVYRLG